jgi:hypothetical protein
MFRGSIMLVLLLQLSCGEGSGFRTQFSDLFGSAPIISPFSIRLENGVAAVNTTTVSISLASENATEMYITKNADCEGGGVWEPYSETISNWTLDNLNAENTVYVKFRSKSGKVSECASDSILHDDVAPTAPTITFDDSANVANQIDNAENAAGVTTTITCALADAGSVFNFTLTNGAFTEGATGICSAGAVTRTFVAFASGAVELSAIVIDAAGNSSTTSNVINSTAVFISPTVTISAPSAGSVNGAGSITYDIDYTNASAINLTVGDVTQNTTGGSNCDEAVSTVDADTRRVTLTNCTGNGTVGITIEPGSSVNGLDPDLGAGPSATFTVDGVPPTIAIAAPSPTDGNSGDTFTFGVTYTGADTIALDAGDVSLDTTGTVSCDAATVSNGTTATPTVSVANCTGDGTVGITVAAGQATDNAGNADAGASSTIDANVDNIAPTIAIAVPSPTDGNSGDTFTFGVTYTGADTIALVAGDVSLDTTGTVSCDAATVSNGTTATPTVSVANCTGDGTVGITIAAGQATDNAGNSDAGASSATDANIDNTAPTIAIAIPSPTDGNSGDTFTFNITYSNAVNFALDAGDVSLDTTGTVSCDAATVSNGTTATPTVSVANCTGDGTVGITIAAGQANDGAGNADAGASSATDANVDNSAPTIAIAVPSPTDGSSGDTFTFNITYSNAVNFALDAGDVSLDTTGTVSCDAATVSNGTTATPTVSVANCTGDGTVGITIAAGQATDASLNGDPGGSSATDANIDNIAPTVTIGAPTDSLINSAGLLHLL